MKEPRVFILSASNFDSSKGGYSMDIWNDYEREGQELPAEAQEFMKQAETEGRVYSLKGFMVAYNINEEVGMNDYVFITSLY